MLKRIRAILLTLVLLSLSFMSMFEDAYAREPYYGEGEFLAYDITWKDDAGADFTDAVVQLPKGVLSEGYVRKNERMLFIADDDDGIAYSADITVNGEIATITRIDYLNNIADYADKTGPRVDPDGSGNVCKLDTYNFDDSVPGSEIGTISGWPAPVDQWTFTKNSYFRTSGSVPGNDIYNTEISFVDAYEIVATTDGNGSATVSQDLAIEGLEITITAIPEPGYRLKTWEVVKGGVTPASLTSSRTTFDVMTSDVEIKAVFEPGVSELPSEHHHHEHSYVWKTTLEPTSESDGIESCICEGCGDVSATRPLPAYSVFEAQIVRMIKNAAEGATVTASTRHFNTLSRGVRNALMERPDVTLTISFLSMGHKGEALKVTIPAGYDITSLYDENGYLGLCRAGSVLGYDQVE